MSKLTRQIIEKTKVQLVEKDMKHTGRSIKKKCIASTPTLNATFRTDSKKR